MTMWAKNSLGQYLEIKAEYTIKISPESNSIRIKANFEGFLCAYVIGDFNDWKKDENYKLIWKPDPNDGRLKMIKDFLFIEGMPDGVVEYSFILIDMDGNELTLSAHKERVEHFKFIWHQFDGGLQIKSSENIVTRGISLDLVAIKSSIHDCNEVVNVKWSVFPKHAGIILNNDSLLVADGVDDIDEILVEAYSQVDDLSASRRYQIVENNHVPGTMVHFIKLNKHYSGNDFIWNLWAYDSAGVGHEENFTAEDDFGKVAFVQDRHVIARKKTWGSDWHNDWSKQTLSFEIPANLRNCYIISGDDKLYTDLRTVVAKTNPRVDYAVMDERNKISAYLSHEPLIGTEFYLYINAERQNNVNTLIKDEKRQVVFTNLPDNIKPNDLVEIRSNTRFLPYKVQMRNYLNSFVYNANDLGITFNDETISAKLWAPTALRVELLVYDAWNDAVDNPHSALIMHVDESSGVHSLTMFRKHHENKYYLYRLYFNEIDRDGEQYTKITYAVDPYATVIGLNGDKGVLADICTSAMYPKGWESTPRPLQVNKEDAVIYELHLRDFTIHESGGISRSTRGKYVGAVEAGSFYQDAEGNKFTTGIDSLVELGITHVHILPFFDFATVDETRLDDPHNRNWGYDPKNYNAPDGSYSVNPYDPLLRIIETRTMIMEFHKRGIRVVMDMVYNHMSDTSNLDNIVPGYYFRSDSLGRFTNGSGCGNELATERPMVGKFILDSIRHWLIHYQIDGLRLDLMELMDLNTMKLIVNLAGEIDPSIIVYGEPWRGGDTPLVNGTHRGAQRDQEFAIFNDAFRDVLRGNNSPARGFVNGDQHNSLLGWGVIEGVKGSINTLTSKPRETINYVDAHDNYTLWDHIEKSQYPETLVGEYRRNIPDNPFDSELVRQNMLALGIILTSQGVPFMQGGVEILRTKNGDHNSYRSGDDVNAFHWQDKAKFKPVFDYVRGLIELRRKHPAFRMTNRHDIDESMTVNALHNNEKSGVIYTLYRNHANGDEWKTIIVIYNATAIDNYNVNDSLPASESGVWNIVVNHEHAGIDLLAVVENGHIPPLKSHSMMVLYA